MYRTQDYGDVKLEGNLMKLFATAALDLAERLMKHEHPSSLSGYFKFMGHPQRIEAIRLVLEMLCTDAPAPDLEPWMHQVVVSIFGQFENLAAHECFQLPRGKGNEEPKKFRTMLFHVARQAEVIDGKIAIEDFLERWETIDFYNLVRDIREAIIGNDRAREAPPMPENNSSEGPFKAIQELCAELMPPELDPDEFNAMSHRGKWKNRKRVKGVWRCPECNGILEDGPYRASPFPGCSVHCDGCDAELTRRTGGGQLDPFNWVAAKC